MTLNYDCCCFIARYLNDSDYLNFCIACNLKPDTNYLTIDFIEENIMELYELNVDFKKIVNELDWYIICIFRKLSEEFLREFKNYIHWQNVCMFQQLSEGFIKEFENDVDWGIISGNQKISTEFVREFKHRIKWRTMSQCRKLSENFIREFKDYVDWSYISGYQHLSERFIAEFQDRIDWQKISKNEKIYRRCDNIDLCLGTFISVLYLIMVISWLTMSCNLYSPSDFVISVCLLTVGVLIAAVGHS
ncbi:hypothetical protein ILUMI_16517 [Ignelater luminosus]|uniref:Uncharacterized protein n=1 Tax=Ignelater luminosus TaxID=2038154 RepID=A0A8K0CQ60_IGNLU|nr:hypothetical protein ILUMI_16517 [Ignelater luminosus]